MDYGFWSAAPDLGTNLLWCALWAFMSSGMFIMIMTIRIIIHAPSFVIASVLDQSGLKESAKEIAEEKMQQRVQQRMQQLSQQKTKQLIQKQN
jgi:hypothetical protein